MPSESVAGFLDRAQAVRVLHPEQIEQLVRQPDLPHSGTGTLCEYLLSRGVLTKFQVDAILDNRGGDLSFAGYPVIDVIGPCEGGTAYRALHPALRTPLVLRRYAPAALGPADDPLALVNRARAFGTVAHPYLLAVLDAGVHQGEPYAVLDQPAGTADLEALMGEVGGAMPGFLAAEYGHAVASALRAVHERGGWHGEVRPGLLVAGPLTTKQGPDGRTKRRPAPHAVVKLTETGLVPVRAPAAVPLAAARCLAPERLAGARPDARGDVYGLGATLYTLLAGRAPHPGETAARVFAAARDREPVPLAQLRPDLDAQHPGLAALVMRMIAKRPEDRPPTALDVCEALAPFCRPGTIPPPPQPAAAAAHPVPAAHPAEDVPLAVPADDWGVSANAFAAAQAASTADRTVPRRRQMSAADKSRSRRWMIVGLGLHLTAVLLLVTYLLGGFDFLSRSDPPRPPDDPPKKQTPPRVKKNKDAS